MSLFSGKRFIHPAYLHIQQLTNVSVFQHTQNNSFPSSCSQSCSFPSVPYFNEQQHIHSIAQARNLTLSPLFLTPKLSNSPHYFSDPFSYLLIYPVTIWAQTNIISYRLIIVSCPASPQDSHNCLLSFTVDATQISPQSCLNSFNYSLFGDREKMKCNDLIIELAYLSSLNFCMPILERLPPITIHYIHFSTTEPIPLLPPNLFVHSISFLLETPFPYPSLLANSYSFFLKTRQAFPKSHDWIVSFKSALKSMFILIEALIRLYMLRVPNGQHIQHLVQCLS